MKAMIMKIATWNMERLAHKASLAAIIETCKQQQADILVLTEADERVYLPEYPYCYSTAVPGAYELPPYTGMIRYAPTERRVLIYSKYPCIQKCRTYDETTALCLELDTKMGELTVYGTIIGIHGNRRASYQQDLEKQLSDIRQIASEGKNLCVCGDYNCSFADNYYFTRAGRSAVLECFREAGIHLVTGKQAECIDHIAITESFLDGVKVSVEEWNEDKKIVGS